MRRLPTEATRIHAKYDPFLRDHSECALVTRLSGFPFTISINRETFSFFLFRLLEMIQIPSWDVPEAHKKRPKSLEEF